MAYVLPYPQYERPRSRGRSVDSRSSSASSAFRLNMDGDFPTVQRWNGRTREATDWNSLRRDPELWHPKGNCLVYLFAKGVSRRGPSFRIPYDFLLYSSCRPLIDHSMTTGLQTSLYHPGSTTPPSYENLSDMLSHESSYCSLNLDAPSDMSQVERYNYHITTRNFFAWLVGAPLVGPDPVSALLDLKVRMDIWRDPGADNFGSLFQYVQEQAYGDFEDLEIQMSKRLGGEAVDRPQPYRNLSQTLEEQQEQQEQEEKRGRRTSLSERIRSGSQKLRKRISRSFSRTRGQSESRTTPPPSACASTPAALSLNQALHKIMQPQLRTQSPPRPQSPVAKVSESAIIKQGKRESSITRFARRRLSWAAGPLRPDGEPMETDSGMVEPVSKTGPPTEAPQLSPKQDNQTSPSKTRSNAQQRTSDKAEIVLGETLPSGPAEHGITALPTLPALPFQALTQASQRLSIRTKDLDAPASPPNVPMRSPRRTPNASTSQINQFNSVGFTPRHSASNSRTSLPDLAICACCGKPRKALGIDPSHTSLHNETIRHTKHGSTYSEISVANYGNGIPPPSHIRRSSAQRRRARHSSSHSFISQISSPPGLDYASSGPVSPISRDSSVDPDPRGRARRISNSSFVGANGMVASPTSPQSMNQMIWQLGHTREQTSASDGSNEDTESEVKKGKKRASMDSATLGYHQATTMSPVVYHQASGMQMVGMAELGQFGAERAELEA